MSLPTLKVTRGAWIGGLTALVFVLNACGFDDDDEDVKGAPPPVVAGDDDSVFALEGGTYYVTSIHDLQDGCGKQPTNATDPLTQVPFVLVNGGNSNVTIDFCSFEGRQLAGDVRGNLGTLSVVHALRKVGGGSHPAEFGQECRLELTVTSANHFDATYVETQRYRNETMRHATVDLPECTTSFKMSMERKD